MLFAGRDVRIVKNCDQGLKQKTRGEKTHASVTVTIVRDRKIQTRTSRIVGFVNKALLEH